MRVIMELKAGTSVLHHVGGSLQVWSGTCHLILPGIQCRSCTFGGIIIIRRLIYSSYTLKLWFIRIKTCTVDLCIATSKITKQSRLLIIMFQVDIFSPIREFRFYANPTCDC